MSFLSDPNTWISLGVLTILEVVLGIDNIVFLILVSHHLPPQQQKLARRVGLSLAMLMRLVLLGAAFLIVQLTKPLFTVWIIEISIRDLLMLVGGGFLLFKGIQEIKAYFQHHNTEHKISKQLSFFSAMVQIILLDIVFSIDTVITAVALTNHYAVMATAVITAVIVMMFASEPINRFIQKYPRVKLLAIIFVLLIGILLVSEGFDITIPHYYLYITMLVLAIIILPNWRQKQ